MTRLVRDGGSWLIDFNDHKFGSGAMPGLADSNWQGRNREAGKYASDKIEDREVFSGAEYDSLYALEAEEGESILLKKGEIEDFRKRQKLAGGYDRDSASNYATEYANDPNSDYVTASNDCTNFVSQCLKAGGWGTDYGWYKSRTRAWWYTGGRPTWSWTWANADYLHDYITASGRGESISNIWDMWYGDILLYDWQDDGYQDHAAICHYRSNDGTLYMAQHTNNYSWKPLSDIVAGASSSWRYFPFRITST